MMRQDARRQRPGRSAGGARPLLRAAVAVVLLGAAAAPVLAATLGEAERSCRDTTMSRLRLGADDVEIIPAPVADGGELTLEWFATDRSAGTCRFSNGRLDWTLTRKGRTIDVETACRSEVARMIRKRPRDVEIVEVEPRGGGATLRWETYQGQTGTCSVVANRVDRVEED